MTEEEELAAQFEIQRPYLHGIAFRMLGSHAEADDAVQEAWLRLARTDGGQHRGPARLADHRDWPDLPGRAAQAGVTGRATAGAPRRHARVGHGRRLAASIRRSRPCSPTPSAWRCTSSWTPSHRPNGCRSCSMTSSTSRSTTIAAILGRSTPAAKMLASRARGRLRLGTPPAGTHAAARDVINAFLAAAGTGDIAALLNDARPRRRAAGTRDPGDRRHPRRRPDRRRRRPGSRVRTRGHTRYSWTASRAFSLPSSGRPVTVMAFTVTDGTVTAIHALTAPTRLGQVVPSWVA